jgi:hypothetical protein
MTSRPPGDRGVHSEDQSLNGDGLTLLAELRVREASRVLVGPRQSSRAVVSGERGARMVEDSPLR